MRGAVNVNPFMATELNAIDLLLFKFVDEVWKWMRKIKKRKAIMVISVQ